jgi:hypothetical protein
LRSEDDNAKEKIALLRESIETLADKEDKSAADYEEIEQKLERVKQVEEEVNELKMLNARLEEENSGLAHRLENVQFVASSTMRGPGVMINFQIGSILLHRIGDLLNMKIFKDYCVEYFCPIVGL